MTAIDLLLLGTLGLFAAWTFVTLRLPRSAGLLAVTAVAGATVIQAIIEGPYWHLMPAYVLAIVCAVAGLTGLGRGHWLGSATWRLAIVVAAGLTGLGWVFLPVPILTPSSGPYAVGTEIYRWVDTSRDEPMSDDPADRRNVVAQVWYPAMPAASGTLAPYLDGLGRLPATISLLPSFLMVHYDRIATAPKGVAVSDERTLWPLVIFSPGYGATRGVYTSLLRDLASRGFVVLALDHPFESAVTELADGRVAVPVERFADDDPDRRLYMVGRLATRVADLRFALDRLVENDGLGPLAGRIDTSRSAAIGHSFGGATAIAAMALDGRIRAAVDIDGALYGAAIDAKLQGPAMVIDSDHDVTGQDSAYFARTTQVLQDAGSGSRRVELEGTHHYSFTDALLLLSPPARWATGQLLGLTRDASDTITATVDLLVTFLAAPLGVGGP